MDVTTLTGTTEDAATLTVLGASAFADTEVGLLQQLLIAVANA
jgi:hypothetical protein